MNSVTWKKVEPQQSLSYNHVYNFRTTSFAALTIQPVPQSDHLPEETPPGPPDAGLEVQEPEIVFDDSLAELVEVETGTGTETEPEPQDTQLTVTGTAHENHAITDNTDRTGTAHPDVTVAPHTDRTGTPHTDRTGAVRSHRHLTHRPLTCQAQAHSHCTLRSRTALKSPPHHGNKAKEKTQALQTRLYSKRYAADVRETRTVITRSRMNLFAEMKHLAHARGEQENLEAENKRFSV